MSTIWYHGSPHIITKITDDFVGSGNDSFGPGIYFASDPEVAKAYGRNVYEITVGNLSLAKTKGGKIPVAKIQKLIKKATDWKDKVENFGYPLFNGFREAVAAMKDGESAWDVLQNIWYDFYRYDTKSFVRNASELGYDGAIIEREQGVLFLVLMNPNKVTSFKLSSEFSSED